MLKEPTSVKECVYFTNRTIGQGHIKAWVYRQKCPKCSNDLMGKPKDSKGKVKTRADYYTCPSCGYTAKKQEYEDTLTAEIKYTCPHCKNKDETTTPFIRKKAKIFDEEEQKNTTAEVLRFQCSKCNKNIDITKKMK